MRKAIRQKREHRLHGLRRKTLIPIFCIAAATLFLCSSVSGPVPDVRVPVLVYHRLGPRHSDWMTVTTPVFQEQMTFIKEHGYHVIPMRELIAYIQRNGPAPPRNSIVITADDGHRSIFEDMYPIIKSYNFPVTLFIYPSAISNAHWAMTWNELQILQKSGLFDIQSHTYWHPNFQDEEKRRSPADYRSFVDWQLLHSKTVLADRLHKNIDLLAWPFGIYNPWLMGEANKAGYVAAFSIERRPVTKSENIMALPRFIVGEADRGGVFEQLLSQ